ncbi:aspartate/methionine/tyrosine aminotransferase [Arcanobacterium wilhelmae]|uniref:Aminotransferase n=1 Tax=Arcanobacterium wilhelmae TaxID=1803177 RepID=A0ABT9NCC2_9ACTO|nr:pyridoxal phosphate-dependent aminotransferase [Arcanobacterium wilhelmae]MDP9801368.1 aspartate/methionine/tyrosine aminotransferase [Arcanobacterium wilhelmae]WFN90704.1 pyridoxal phosphate-dependent aminotransferase [Arcanobacterium wilhelmae]
MRLSTHVSSLTPSATLAVDLRAKELAAAGRPIIGFGAGEPDFPTAKFIVNAAVEAARDPRNHHYTAAAGLAELREAIAAKALKDSGTNVDPTNVIVTNGGKQAVYQAFMATVSPGDDVLLPAPYWTTYPEAIRLAGGNPIEVFAPADAGYKVTVDQLEAAYTSRTTTLLMCSPSNPTGAVYTADELHAIGQWAIAKDLWVISDEIYENLVYEGEMAYLLRVVPELADRLITVNGVAKSYAMTGWRVGWMFGPAEVIRGARILQGHLSSHVNNIAQRAALAALNADQHFVSEMKVAFNRRRLALVEALEQIDAFSVPTPSGAFYVFANVERALGQEINGKVATTSAQLADLILEEADVALVPGEAFGAPGHLRLSYALADDALAEGAQRLVQLFSQVK